MRLFCNIFVLATTITIIYSAPLTTEQEESLDHFGWLYAQFSLTFDADKLPLDDFYRSPEGQQHFEQFEEVQDFFNDSNLQKHFPDIQMNELNSKFQQRIEYYQHIIIKEDKPPVSFNIFYFLFSLIKNDLEKISIYRLTVTEQACIDITVDERKVKEALNQYQIYGRFPSKPKKLERDEKRPHTFIRFREYLEGSKDPKPKTWTFHHIIPSHILTTFYHNYFTMFTEKSEKMKQNHKFDWIKIVEINTQKSFLIQASKLWSTINPNAKLPVNDFKKKKDGQQEDFVRAWYRLPPGLIFYGPESKIRSDDPIDKIEKNSKHIIGTAYFEKVKQLYNDIKAFNSYYQIAKNKDSENLNKEATRLYQKILTINKEYYGLPIYIFPFNTDQWIKEDDKEEWKINTNFNADAVVYVNKLGWIDMNDNSCDWSYVEVARAKDEWKTWNKEWREKALAQEEDYRRQMFLELPMINLPTPNFNIPTHVALGFVNRGQDGASSSKNIHDENKRRKRHHYHMFDLAPTTYIDYLRAKCKTLNTTTTSTTTTTTESIKVHFNRHKSDPCSYYLDNGTPSIIAVPYYGICKLFS